MTHHCRHLPIACLLLVIAACGDTPSDPPSGGNGTTGNADTGKAEPGAEGTVGSASTTGGATLGDGSTTSEPAGSATTSDDPGSPPVLPTWILRDADGEPVPALVSPSCGQMASLEGPCPLQEIGDEHLDYNCVTVAVLYGREWNIAFALDDGSPTDCVRHFDSWDSPSTDDSAPGTYLEADCAGLVYSPAGGPASTIDVGGALYYGFGEAAELPCSGSVPISRYERFYDQDGPAHWACSNSMATGDCSLFGYPFVEATAEVYDLLDNPPYTLTLEY